MVVSVVVRVEPAALVSVWLSVSVLLKESVVVWLVFENDDVLDSLVVAKSVDAPVDESVPVSLMLSKCCRR